MACYANTFPRALTCPAGMQKTSPPSPTPAEAFNEHLSWCLRPPIESSLAAAIAVDHAPGDITPAGYRPTESLGGQSGLHPRVDGVAHDAVGEHVFDRTQVELALAGAVFDIIIQPQPIWFISGETAADQVIIDRWADLAVLAALTLAERTPPAVARTDPPRGPLGHLAAGIAGLGDQEAVPELRVIAMGVEQRVGAIGLG